GLLVAVLVLDEWLAPWFPLWLLVALVTTGSAALELVGLLNETSARPSGNTVFGGVIALVLANWAPHVLPNLHHLPHLSHRPARPPRLRPADPRPCPRLAPADVRRRGDDDVRRAERPVREARGDDGDDLGHGARGGVRRAAGELRDPVAVARRPVPRVDPTGV